MIETQTRQIIDNVTSYTGIRVPSVLADYVSTYIAKQASLSSLDQEEYCRLLVPGTSQFENLIVEITINETYFFREEQQFEFLKNFVFPNFLGKKMIIWSGACSSGEEPLSLCALATSCGVHPVVYASDIDHGRLKYFKNGVYSRASFRKEGNKFWSLLESSKCGTFSEKSFILSKNVFDKIHICPYNLNGEQPPPVPSQVNLIFLRNVFIYFDKENRRKILAKLSKVLAPDGLIFLSSSEIGSMSKDLLPEDMHKVNYGSLYFLVKKANTDFVVNTHLVKETVSVKNEQEVKKAAEPVKHSNVLTKIHHSINKKFEKASKNIEVKKPVVPFPNISLKTEAEPLDIVFQKIKSLLSEKKPEDARDIIQNYNPEEKDLVYKDFFSAFIEGKVGNFYVAEKLFTQIVKEHPDFWPGLFFHAILLKEISRDEEAKVLFSKCATLIDTYEKSGDTHFDFIAGDLSVAFFYIMCLKFSH